jgi:arginase
MSNIKLIEVNSELGAGTRGAALGVEALKVAAINAKSTFFKDNKSVKVKCHNQLLLNKIKYPFAKRIEGIIKVNSNVSKHIAKTLKGKKGIFPVVLAGDHSSAAGTIAGIKKAFPKKRLGVVWIDAHADMHSPYTSPSGNIHGMPLAVALGLDNRELSTNNVDNNTIKLWNKLKKTGGLVPKIFAENLVLVGVRDTERQEDYLIEKYNIKKITVEELWANGEQRTAIEILQYLDKCDLIYISFDVDSMDDEISKGTGTPVPNGLDPEEASNLINKLLKNEKVCCFEMVEINPTLDIKNKMADTAFKILDNATEVIKKKNKKIGIKTPKVVKAHSSFHAETFFNN